MQGEPWVAVRAVVVVAAVAVFLLVVVLAVNFDHRS